MLMGILKKFQVKLADRWCDIDLENKFNDVINITEFYKSYHPQEETSTTYFSC